MCTDFPEEVVPFIISADDLLKVHEVISTDDGGSRLLLNVEII
jgi:hypothetical protein